VSEVIHGSVTQGIE